MLAFQDLGFRIAEAARRGHDVLTTLRIPFNSTCGKSKQEASASDGDAGTQGARGAKMLGARIWKLHQSARTRESIHMGRRQKIKQFILGNFLFTDDESAFSDDTSLIREGIVDSTGILELIGFIEESWPVRVPPEDMTPSNFDSLGAIDRYLDGQLAA
ncbi:acyl carrier protein [Luteimonas sp. A649]